MLGYNRWHLFKGLAALLSIWFVCWLALAHFVPAPPSTITFASGAAEGNFEHIAQRYRESLARHRVTLNLHPTKGSADHPRLIEDRNSGVDAGYVLGGNTDSKQSPGLMSLGRVTYNPIWFFYRGPETLDRLSQLKGKRIGGNFTAGLAAKILATSGINADNATLVTLAGPASAKALRDGEVDVIMPFGEVNTPLIQSLLRDPNVRLISLTQAEGLSRVYPYLSRLVLPQGVMDFEKNIPATDVSLIATTTAIVVRKDLHPELVYLLAQALMEEHGPAGLFHRAGDFPTQTDPEFPFAEQAHDFYKNGPSFMQRYLPFWMINISKRVVAVMLAAVAIILPLFNYVPRLYRWMIRERIARLYRRLRAVEKGMQPGQTAAEVEALQSDLESIERAVSILGIPIRHSDLFYALKIHINLVRARIASHLVEARSRTAKTA